MSETARSPGAGPRTYGNFRRPTAPGVGPLGLVGTVVMFAGALVFALLIVFQQLLVAAGWSVLVLLLLATLMVKDHHGRSGLEKLVTRVAWRRTRRAGRNHYRAGPIAKTGTGRCQLPGLLARSRVSEWEDSYARPFCLVEHESAGHVAVVLRCEPDGSSLVDPEQVEHWVGQWGQWLAALGQEMGVVAAAVTVETAPDTGARLRREISGQMSDEAPDLARRVLNQIMVDYPSGAAEVRAWVSLTFQTQAAVGGRRRAVADMAREIGSRLPGLTQGLHDTGAGAVSPVTAQELCEVVRVAYDPTAASPIDEVLAAGERPDLDWSDVGPAASEASWDSYRHDSALSRTWMMTVAPRGEVFSNVLGRLLAPHSDIDRKRVTLIYRPIEAAKAAQIVENDKRTADFTINNAQRPSARQLGASKAAYATAQEEARGAGLVDFGLLVTATVTDPDRMPDARATVENLGAAARLQLRPVFGSQDSAFAAALPLGMVLPAHARVPQNVRNAL